jgi:hypothetical protein
MTFGLIGDHYQFLFAASALVNMSSEELEQSLTFARESIDNFSAPDQREHVENVIWLLETVKEMLER